MGMAATAAPCEAAAAASSADLALQAAGMLMCGNHMLLLLLTEPALDLSHRFTLFHVLYFSWHQPIFTNNNL